MCLTFLGCTAAQRGWCAQVSNGGNAVFGTLFLFFAVFSSFLSPEAASIYGVNLNS